MVARRSKDEAASVVTGERAVKEEGSRTQYGGDLAVPRGNSCRGLGDSLF